MQNEVLAGRFRITGLLGSGGMGRVWAAQDERMRRDVAVKIVHPQYRMDEAETQARFQREVQLAGRLAHQNIVTVHDWGEASVDGRPTLFLVMELVQGQSLDGRLKASTPSWPLAVGWAAQIAEALHAAHRQGVVHRDIKPANALLTPEGTVKVLDFGVAKFMGETLGARELTVTGTPVGSPLYMSPEQAEGDKTIDHRSDLYSLGCLLYDAVTGRPPFVGGSQWSVLRQHMQDEPKPPASRVEGLPAPLNDLILTLLAKRPEDRPADAAVVYETLSTLLADHAVTQPGGGILDVTQLGHSHSVAGLMLKRAWELYQWTEWNRAAGEQAVEAQLEAARAEADRLASEARQRLDQELAKRRQTVESHINENVAWAEQLRARTESQARRLLDESRAEAEAAKAIAQQLVADAQVKAARIVTEASEKARTLTAEESATQLSKAAKTAEDVLNRASEEAEQTTKGAVEEAERIRSEAEAEADRLRAEAHDIAEGLKGAAKDDTKEYRAKTVELQEEARRLRDEAVQLHADAVAEGESIRSEARREAVQQIEEAARSAEELLAKAKADADALQQAPTAPELS